MATVVAERLDEALTDPLPGPVDTSGRLFLQSVELLPGVLPGPPQLRRVRWSRAECGRWRRRSRRRGSRRRRWIGSARASPPAPACGWPLSPASASSAPGPSGSRRSGWPCELDDRPLDRPLGRAAPGRLCGALGCGRSPGGRSEARAPRPRPGGRARRARRSKATRCLTPRPQCLPRDLELVGLFERAGVSHCEFVSPTVRTTRCPAMGHPGHGAGVPSAHSRMR